jgi:hypothetical protein
MEASTARTLRNWSVLGFVLTMFVTSKSVYAYSYYDGKSGFSSQGDCKDDVGDTCSNICFAHVEAYQGGWCAQDPISKTWFQTCQCGFKTPEE